MCHTAPWGGGLHCAESARLTAAGGSMVMVNAGESGGGLYAEGFCKVGRMIVDA